MPETLAETQPDLASRPLPLGRNVTAGLVLTVGLATGSIQVGGPGTFGMEQRSVNVPPGRPVMVDGVIDAGEWSDAALAETVAGRLHIKEVGEFVLVGLELPGQSAGFVDLFITAGGGPLYDLHASARLGERILTGRVWPEWHWWNNSGWVANVSRVESFDERTFLPEHAREFQIRRSRFPGRPWRIRLLTTVMKGKEITTLVWPEKTEDTNAAGWLELELSITARPRRKT